MISNPNKGILQSGGAVRGFSSSRDAENSRQLAYPGVLENMYRITSNGRVYSIITDTYIAWGIRNNLPYVNLSCKRDNKITLEPFYIKDLMACNYIPNGISYLERGYRALNIDGDPMNCDYRNIIYIQ